MGILQFSGNVFVNAGRMDTLIKSVKSLQPVRGHGAGQSPRARKPMPVRQILETALRNDPLFFVAKFDDFRAFNATVAIIFAILASALWVCDYVVSPFTATHTLVLRALFPLCAAPYVICLLSSRSARLGVFLWFVGIVAAESLYVEILQQFGGDFVGGTSGFLFFLLIPFLMAGSLTLRINLISLLVLSDWPLAMSMAGLAPGLNWAEYCVTIWPASGLSACGVCAFSYIYRMNYESQHRLEIAAGTDALTGAANRRRFGDTINEAIGRCRRYNSPLSVVLLDIDHFKQINDRWGHATGDRAICHVVDACRSAVREIDVVGRIGGEEFAILLQDTTRQAGMHAAERVRSLLHHREFLADDGTRLSIRCSFGLAEYLPHDPGSEALLRRADIALYNAKSAGRDRVVEFT